MTSLDTVVESVAQTTQDALNEIAHQTRTYAIAGLGIAVAGCAGGQQLPNACKSETAYEANGVTVTRPALERLARGGGDLDEYRDNPKEYVEDIAHKVELAADGDSCVDKWQASNYVRQNYQL